VEKEISWFAEKLWVLLLALLVDALVCADLFWCLCERREMILPPIRLVLAFELVGSILSKFGIVGRPHFSVSTSHLHHDASMLTLLRMSSLASFLLWLGVSANLLVLLFLLTRLCRGPSLVNTVALTGLLRRVSLSLSYLSLENTRAVCEGRVPLDAVTGFVFSSWASSFCRMTLILRTVFAGFDTSFHRRLGVFVCPEVFLVNFLCHDWQDLIVVFFTNFLKLVRRETPKINVVCFLTPFAGCVSDCGIGEGCTSRGALILYVISANERQKVIVELERLRGSVVSMENVAFRMGFQKRDMVKTVSLLKMVIETHLTMREKISFATKMRGS
ncbi:hypothetical protein Tco_1170930, partial [Tanacetum coccineum]